MEVDAPAALLPMIRLFVPPSVLVFWFEEVISSAPLSQHRNSLTVALVMVQAIEMRYQVAADRIVLPVVVPPPPYANCNAPVARILRASARPFAVFLISQSVTVEPGIAARYT